MMYLGLVNVRMPDGRIIKFGANQENRQQDAGESGNDGENKAKPKKRGLFGWGR